MKFTKVMYDIYGTWFGHWALCPICQREIYNVVEEVSPEAMCEVGRSLFLAAKEQFKEEENAQHK